MAVERPTIKKRAGGTGTGYSLNVNSLRIEGATADPLQLLASQDDGAGGVEFVPVSVDDLHLGGASLSDATPAALGTAAAGVSTDASRADHVHKKPAAADISDATATGRALLTAANAAAQRAALGVYSAAEVDAAIAAVGAVLATSANATVTDASPAGDGSAAIDSGGVITLVAEGALAGGFAASPKISLAFTGDAGSRFRARVRLVSKSGPSSNSLLALYFKGVAGLAIYARISGQIGVWDLGAAVPATASVSALWDGSEYLEIRMVDGYLHFGVWQGTTYTTVYLTTTTVRPTTVGVMFGKDGGAATQTVVTDSFEITDLRAW